jgi:hypothetical protein
MNTPTVETVWQAFDRVDVAGRSMAECKLCQHRIVTNRGTMCMHYRMKHCNPTNGPRQTDALVSKPICDKPQAFAPSNPCREVCTDICSKVWQRHIDYVKKRAGEVSDTHSDDSVVSDSELRRRFRTMNMLRYLAAEPSGAVYAAIIEGADDQIIKAIRGVGRAFIHGYLGDLSPVESLALGRYRKSIEGFSDYANSTQCTRKALLKPAKVRRCVSGSAVYMPMLLTLALSRGGLEAYVDNDDDASDASSFSTADFEDSHDSSNDASEESSDDSREHGQDPSDERVEEISTEHSEQSDEANEEASMDQSDQSDEGSEEASTEQSDESSEEASTEQSGQSDESNEETSTEQSDQSDEGSEEASTERSDQSDEGSEEASTERSDQSEEGDEEEVEADSEGSEDAESDESEEVEDEESEAEREDKDHVDQHSTKSLKRRHAEESSTSFVQSGGKLWRFDY